MAKINNISIREQKYAQTKLNILQCVMGKLNHKPLSEITVKEICEELLLSDATFFNYFPKKSDILIFFIQNWTIQMLWLAKKKYGLTSGLKIIEKVFEETAKSMKENPYIMNEIISFMALTREMPDFKKLSLAEKLVSFPDYEGIEFIEDDQLNSIFYNNIILAIEQGELPADTNPISVMTAVSSVFFGVPVMYKGEYLDFIPATYNELLNKLWVSFKTQENKNDL